MTNKRGGQPGNQNARKHGIYSHFIAVADEVEIDGMSDEKIKDELALARARLVTSLREYERAQNTEDRLKWESHCSHYIEILLTAKTRSRELRQTENVIWQSFIEAIRAANDRQGVVK